jgi:hypothetical protein
MKTTPPSQGIRKTFNPAKQKHVRKNKRIEMKNHTWQLSEIRAAELHTVFLAQLGGCQVLGLMPCTTWFIWRKRSASLKFHHTFSNQPVMALQKLPDPSSKRKCLPATSAFVKSPI